MALPTDHHLWAVPFPDLKLDPKDPVSDATTKYNCIAYAAGDQKHWWDNRRYWPKKALPAEWSLDGLSRAFATLGYEVCADGGQENGVEKVAFYESRTTGKPTHAARQLSDGRWTSKCGPQEDVVHKTPECLSGDEYGDPVRFMKRPRKGK